MKVGIITQSNKKGQIVIPIEIRKSLGINSSIPLKIVLRGNGIYIYPIGEVIPAIETENSYPKILEKTRGAWAIEKKGNLKEHQKRKLEVSASKRRRREW